MDEPDLFLQCYLGQDFNRFAVHFERNGFVILGKVHCGIGSAVDNYVEVFVVKIIAYIGFVRQIKFIDIDISEGEMAEVF